MRLESIIMFELVFDELFEIELKSFQWTKNEII